jgi:glycosyltransferase involved in cell wall biosynthesis
VEKQNYVLYFGRFAKEKGIETFLKACKALPDIPFVAAGSGPLEGELAGIQNLKNVGFQSGKALEKLIVEARFSVYPSEWYENCPFSVMESLMYGTPVLGADIGGIPELIDAGVNGELFESGNVDALTEKIRALWDDRTRLDAYTRACETTRFDTVEEYAEKLMPLYQG